MIKGISPFWIGLTLAMFGIAGCHALVPANPRSLQKSGELVSVTIVPDDEPEAIPGIAAALAPKAIEYVFQIVQRELAKEASRYTAHYSAFVVGDGFYDSPRPDASMRFEGIRIERIIRDPAGGTELVPAMTLYLSARPSADGAFFRLSPQQLRVDYAKAKLRRHDDSLDIRIQVAIHTFWIDDDRNAQTHKMVLPAMYFRDVMLGKQYTHTDRSMREASSWWIPMLARTALPPGEDRGTGTFVVAVSVTESDAFGKLLDHVNEVVSEYKDRWTGVLLDHGVGNKEK